MELFHFEAAGRHYSISVSPETRDLLINDPEYCAQYLGQVLALNVDSDAGPSTQRIPGEGTEPAPGISPVPPPHEPIDQSGEEPFADPCGSKICWLEKDVKLLIALYRELNKFLGKIPKCKSKAKMFREISKRMAEQGCTYTPIQVEIKWRNLEKKYKKSLQHNQKTGRNRTKVEFESELGEILNKKAGVIPDYVLNSADSGKSRKEIMEALEIEDEAPENNENTVIESGEENISTSTPKVKRYTKKAAVRDVLEKYREDRQAADSAKAEFRQSFLTAYNRRTEAVERKNLLLETLISKMADQS